MAGITIKGMPALQAAFDKMIDRTRSNLYDMRVQIARELTLDLVKNIPVWSGRTISSITWGAQSTQSLQPHPQRGGYDIEGPYHADPTFGMTSKMGLGEEPMRAGAEAIAMGEVESLVGFFGDKAVLTINSVPWELIEQGRAPGGPNQKPRNTAVVSEIALAQVRSKFSGIIKS